MLSSDDLLAFEFLRLGFFEEATGLFPCNSASSRSLLALRPSTSRGLLRVNSFVSVPFVVRPEVAPDMVRAANA